jgi:hypothetical protein
MYLKSLPIFLINLHPIPGKGQFRIWDAELIKAQPTRKIQQRFTGNIVKTTLPICTGWISQTNFCRNCPVEMLSEQDHRIGLTRPTVRPMLWDFPRYGRKSNPFRVLLRLAVKGNPDIESGSEILDLSGRSLKKQDRHFPGDVLTLEIGVTGFAKNLENRIRFLLPMAYAISG